MISKKQLNYKYKKLFFGEVDTGFSVVPDEVEGMWRVRWPDGVLSADYYNYTRARDHGASLYLEAQNKGSSSLTGAFK